MALDGANDLTLVAAAQHGDRSALEALLGQQHDRIYALAYRMLGDQRDAEDAAQDALLALVKGLPRFDGRAAFSTWVYRITTNICLDELRRRRRRPVTVELADDLASGAPGQHEATIDSRLEIDTALARLPEQFRIAVVLRDLCDLDYAQIAEVLAIPAGTVRSRIARGRAELARALAGNPADPDGRRNEVT